MYRLVEYLSLPEDNASYHLKIQAATILGSIAYGLCYCLIVINAHLNIYTLIFMNRKR